GIWKTTNATDPARTWTPLIDDFPSLSISAITFDPRDPTGNTLFAGFGERSSFDFDSGPLIGFMKTSDGGLHWDFNFVGNGLRGKNIRKIVASPSVDPV